MIIANLLTAALILSSVFTFLATMNSAWFARLLTSDSATPRAISFAITLVMLAIPPVLLVANQSIAALLAGMAT